MVVLPDHLHCIWTLPPGDAYFAARWRLISRGSPSTVTQDCARNRIAQGQRSENKRYGNIAIGNMRCGTKPILPGMSSTFISTR